MKTQLLIMLLLVFSFCNAQSLPIDFENSIITEDFIDFDGGVASVIANPQSQGINTSATVAQIIRDGGAIWAGSKIELANNLDFTIDNTIKMKVYTTAPVGTTVKFKLEGDGSTERDVQTSLSGEWEELEWDFTGTPSSFNQVVFMFDFGNVGDGSESSTFLFDDITQNFGGTQIDWPVDFEGSGINYTVTDFGGNVSLLTTDPLDADNHVIQTIKTDQAATWAGTTIGTPAGFATDIPLALGSSWMNVRVWSPVAGTPIRLKVEDSSDPTHTCETEVNTTVNGGWETIEFDFADQASGTESLSVGLSMGWTFNMASIFFNFGAEGAIVGEETYYFDDVNFGALITAVDHVDLLGIEVFPNPSTNYWHISSQNAIITKVELYSMQGELIQISSPNHRSLSMAAQSYPKGIYLAKIITDKGSATVKLIK